MRRAYRTAAAPSQVSIETLTWLPAVVSGNVITFSIADGGLGDDDFALRPNGTVVDQSGPGAGLMSVPVLSEGGLALLGVSAVGVGLGQFSWEWSPFPRPGR